MQYNDCVERDGHELVGEEEPSEAVNSLAYERSVLQASSKNICSATDSALMTLLPRVYVSPPRS